MWRNRLPALYRPEPRSRQRAPQPGGQGGPARSAGRLRLERGDVRCFAPASSAPGPRVSYAGGEPGGDRARPINLGARGTGPTGGRRHQHPLRWLLRRRESMIGVRCPCSPHDPGARGERRWPKGMKGRRHRGPSRWIGDGGTSTGRVPRRSLKNLPACREGPFVADVENNQVTHTRRRPPARPRTRASWIAPKALRMLRRSSRGRQTDVGSPSTSDGGEGRFSSAPGAAEGPPDQTADTMRMRGPGEHDTMMVTSRAKLLGGWSAQGSDSRATETIFPPRAARSPPGSELDESWFRPLPKQLDEEWPGWKPVRHPGRGSGCGTNVYGGTAK